MRFGLFRIIDGLQNTIDLFGYNLSLECGQVKVFNVIVYNPLQMG